MSTENFIIYDKVKEKKEPKLKFLNKIIDPNDISKINIDLVDDEHLKQLDNHFKKIEKKFKNTEVSSAANGIRKKINFIVGSSSNNISGEIMQAANNPDYGDSIKIA